MGFRDRGLVLALVCLVVACSPKEAEPPVLEAAPDALPVARWDHRPEAERWTRTTLDALSGTGAPLLELVPSDIETWCPAYPAATEAERQAFWVGLLSSLAKHESTWRPDVSGGDGRWHGLLQISPGTARGYGCEAQSATALKDGSANLRCAIRIMAVTVPRDGVISRNGRGVAADWGPFHQAGKRQDMIASTRALPSCREG